MFKYAVLGSGSKGNSIIVSDDNTTIMIDAGFSGTETDNRLHTLGLKIKDIDAVLITHDHGDHINGAGVVARNSNASVFIEKEGEFKIKRRIGKKVTFSYFTDETPFTIGEFTITPFSVPHDAIFSVGFIFEKSGKKLGVLTDFGKETEIIKNYLSQCNHIVIEANHDEEMVKNSSYSDILKERILGEEGHISNADSIKLINSIYSPKLFQLVFVHLSDENNSEEVLLQEAQKLNSNIDITISSQNKPTDFIRIT